MIAPVRTYRLRGGYRLLVTKALDVWQEREGRHTLLATASDWSRRNGGDLRLSRGNACRAANFWGYGT